MKTVKSNVRSSLCQRKALKKASERKGWNQCGDGRLGRPVERSETYSSVSKWAKSACQSLIQ